MITARVLFSLYLATLMFSLGLGLAPETGDKKAARREHLHVFLRGLLLTLIVIPLVALGLTQALKPSTGVAIALLVLVAAPGGRYAPQIARFAGADLSVSSELTLLLVKLTAFTAPPMARFLLGAHHVDVADIPIILSLILLQILPLYLGKAVRRWRGEFAERIETGLQLFVNVLSVGLFGAILALTGLGGFTSLGGRGLLTIVSLAFLSGVLAWLFCGPKALTRRAVIIAANAHNLALALIVATTSFPERRLQSTILAAWLVFLGINFLFTLAVRQRTTRPTAGVTAPPAHAVRST